MVFFYYPEPEKMNTSQTSKNDSLVFILTQRYRKSETILTTVRFQDFADNHIFDEQFSKYYDRDLLEGEAEIFDLPDELRSDALCSFKRLSHNTVLRRLNWYSNWR